MKVRVLPGPHKQYKGQADNNIVSKIVKEMVG
jgi:hypothetical protein